MTYIGFLELCSTLMMALHFWDKINLEIQRKEGERKETSKWAAIKSVLFNVRDQTDKEQESNHGIETAFNFIWKISPLVGREISLQCIKQSVKWSLMAATKQSRKLWEMQQMSGLDFSTLSFVFWEVQDNLLSPLLCPPGTHGEIRLLAENGQPGKDVEKTMVCSQKQTNHVLQVPGKLLGYISSSLEVQRNLLYWKNTFG